VDVRYGGAVDVRYDGAVEIAVRHVLYLPTSSNPNPAIPVDGRPHNMADGTGPTPPVPSGQPSGRDGEEHCFEEVVSGLSFTGLAPLALVRVGFLQFVFEEGGDLGVPRQQLVVP